MLHSSLLISFILIHLYILSITGFEVAVNQPDDTFNQDAVDCAGSDIISQMCSRCSGFIESVSGTNCCTSLDAQHQCLKLLDQVDNVEGLLPAGLEDIVDEDAESVENVGVGGLLNRVFANTGNLDSNGLDNLDHGSEPSGLDLLLEDPDSYDSLSKRGGLSSKYNRVWWRGPSKRPNNNRVFKNFNRIWWRKDRRS